MENDPPQSALLLHPAPPLNVCDSGVKHPDLRRMKSKRLENRKKHTKQQKKWKNL